MLSNPHSSQTVRSDDGTRITNMRNLMKRRVVVSAFLAGMATSLLCVPFLVLKTPPGSMRTLRVASLVPVTVILYQVSIAWTSFAPNCRIYYPEISGRSYGRFLLLAALLTLSVSLVIDPILNDLRPGYYPDSIKEVIFALPWVALFQPLFLVLGVFAFTARLTKRTTPALVAVLITHQVLLSLQLESGIDTKTHAMLLLLAGAHGMIMAWSFFYYGAPGPMIISLTLHLRYFARFM